MYCYTCRRKTLEGRDLGCGHSGMLSAGSIARGPWVLGVSSKGGSLAAPTAGEERWHRGDAEKSITHVTGFGKGSERWFSQCTKTALSKIQLMGSHSLAI